MKNPSGKETCKASDSSLNIRYETSISVSIDTDDGEVSATLLDISVVGLRLKTDRWINPGVEIEVRLPGGSPTQIRGKVSWVLNVLSAHGLHHYEVGVAISDVAMPQITARGLAARVSLMPELLYLLKSKNPDSNEI